MCHTLGVAVGADHQPVVVDPVGHRVRRSSGTRDVGKLAVLINEPSDCAAGIQVAAHDHTAGIDISANGLRTLWVIDAGQFIAISHEAAHDPLPGLVLSDDHARVVNPPRDVLSAPGTLTVVNLKVKVGALAAVAAMINASPNPGTSSSVLQVLIILLSR